MADQNALRASLIAFMKDRRLGAKPWATASGLSDRTLGMFLKNPSASITMGTLQKLAKSQGVPVEVLLNYPAEGRSEHGADGAEDEADGVMANAELIVRLLKDIKELHKEQISSAKALHQEQMAALDRLSDERRAEAEEGKSAESGRGKKIPRGS